LGLGSEKNNTDKFSSMIFVEKPRSLKYNKILICTLISAINKVKINNFKDVQNETT